MIPMDRKQVFLKHLAQTSKKPLMLEIEKAEGVWMYDHNGKKFLDLISGIAVSNLGHSNPKIIQAIKQQLDAHMHIMVYGELIQTPQVRLAKKLVDLLPENLQSIYFVNSGSEAVDGAIKLARKVTDRSGIISYKNAYHGSTCGALSFLGDEKLKDPFRPLLPAVTSIRLNHLDDLKSITKETACVLLEPVQGEAGVKCADKTYVQALQEKCKATGSLLIFDEIQTGMGRTGSMFRFENLDVVPDVLLLSKALGGGMPLGAIISSVENMQQLNSNPELGHLTTFGGHPVCCAAALASINVLEETQVISSVRKKEAIFLQSLKHPEIKEIRSCGLMIAVELDSSQTVQKVIEKCIQNGVLTDWFLLCDNSLRVAPPLIISEDEIKIACDVIIQSIEETTGK